MHRAADVLYPTSMHVGEPRGWLSFRTLAAPIRHAEGD